MKQVILFLITLLLIYLSARVQEVDRECKKFQGWTFYSLYPEPMCHVEKNVSPLKDLWRNDIEIEGVIL